MYDFNIRIANVVIRIRSKYKYTYSICEDYLCDEEDYKFFIKSNNKDVSKFVINNRVDIAESLSIYKNIVENLFSYNMLLIHAAAIEYKNNAYLFLGPSGAGKSTHIKLLKSVEKDIKIINGDKPIIDEKGYVYGTPWAGKERWQKNSKVRIKAVIFVNKDKRNHIKELNKNDCIGRLLNQCNFKGDIEKTIEILNKALSKSSFYELYCTNTTSAAKLSLSRIVNHPTG